MDGTLFHSSSDRALRSLKSENLVQPALAMIISMPPSLSTVSLTIRTLSSALPASYVHQMSCCEAWVWTYSFSCKCLDSQLLTRLDDLLSSVFRRDVVNHHIGTFFGELLGYQSSEAPAASGDEHIASFERIWHVWCFLSRA